MSNWKDTFPKENKYFEVENGILFNGDVLEILKKLPAESIDNIITSPPYWALRDYGVEGQIGLEKDFNEYLEKLWQIFDEIYRVLKPTGTCFVNLGDTYFSKTKGSGGTNSDMLKRKGRENFQKFSTIKIKLDYTEKSLCMIPERFAIGMIERGWILRNVIIWHKPNAMPESVKDRFTKDFEYIYFFVKNKKYYFNQQFEKAKYEVQRTIKGTGLRTDEIKRNRKGGMAGTYTRGRNKRTVWTMSTKSFREAHFAVFPPDIPEICIKAGCPDGGIVLDPFMGSGTTAMACEKLQRKWIGIELNSEYCEIAKRRILSAIRII